MTATSRFSRPYPVVNGRTLEEVVRLYLAEFDNPALDFAMRQVYRRWMAEFVGDDGAES